NLRRKCGRTARRAACTGSSGAFLKMSSNRSRIASRWAAGADHSTSRGAADLVRARAFADDAKLMRSLEARANEIRRFRPPRSQRSSAARILRGTAEDRRSLRSRRLLCLSYRRASRDAAGTCRLAQRLPRRRRAAHAAPALRSAGLYPSAPPSAAGGGGDLHARPAQRGTLGVGRGISPIETAYYGINPDNRQKMYLEALQILRQALTGRTLTFHGEFYHYADVPIELEPFQKPHPPFWAGAGTPDAAEAAGRNGFHLVANALTS